MKPSKNLHSNAASQKSDFYLKINNEQEQNKTSRLKIGELDVLLEVGYSCFIKMRYVLDLSSLCFLVDFFLDFK